MIFEIALWILYKKLGEKETVVIAGEFNGPIGYDPENYEDQHESYGHGIRNKEEERFLNFVQLWHDSMEYTFRNKGESSNHLWVWSIKN